jgi:hypothetical protein
MRWRCSMAGSNPLESGRLARCPAQAPAQAPAPAPVQAQVQVRASSEERTGFQSPVRRHFAWAPARGRGRPRLGPPRAQGQKRELGPGREPPAWGRVRCRRRRQCRWRRQGRARLASWPRRRWLLPRGPPFLRSLSVQQVARRLLWPLWTGRVGNPTRQSRSRMHSTHRAHSARLHRRAPAKSPCRAAGRRICRSRPGEAARPTNILGRAVVRARGTLRWYGRNNSAAHRRGSPRRAF